MLSLLSPIAAIHTAKMEPPGRGPRGGGGDGAGARGEPNEPADVDSSWSHPKPDKKHLLSDPSSQELGGSVDSYTRMAPGAADGSSGRDAVQSSRSNLSSISEREQTAPLASPVSSYRQYKRRWLTLFIFFMLNVSNAVVCMCIIWGCA